MALLKRYSTFKLIDITVNGFLASHEFKVSQKISCEYLASDYKDWLHVITMNAAEPHNCKGAPLTVLRGPIMFLS